MNETDIAIIGMVGRFPGAANVNTFWANLCDGVEGIHFFSDQELLAAGVSPAQLNNPNYVKAKGVVADAALFDAAFFGFTPREAEILDVQHRLFLECAWQAIEQAGYDTTAVSFPIAVYAGVGLNSYLLQNIYPHAQGGQTADLYQLMLGNDKDFLPTRVAYKLNLHGPALAVQTACSSSLVAIHLACQSLLNGECDMALAGGVTVALPQEAGYMYQEGMILSPDGHCRAFDAQAGGTVGGNGVGIVVLKRLEEAIADGDFIWAVVKGTAVNNDGSQKIGYTAPSQQGQAAVIREALAVAGVQSTDISYIETHGTGTSLGDPVELAALGAVFGRSAGEKWCALGAVKTNVGHLDAAAGVTGFIKTALALHHRQIPPTLHFTQPNPEMDFANTPFYINTQLMKWPENGRLRCAGVSSFGIGGTNAHVVLQEWPQVDTQQPTEDTPQLLVLSGRTVQAVETAVSNLANHLEAHPKLNLADVAFTLANGRKPFTYRRFAVAQSAAHASDALRNPAQPIQAPPSPPAVAFLFPGQGTQYAGMGQGLLHYPLFRQTLAQCDKILRPFVGWSLLEVVAANTQYPLSNTQYAQPALFALEYALAQLWVSWGIRPSLMLGHSLGEFVAACLAEVFSLEDGLWLVAKRGQLMQSMPPGQMLSVNLSPAAIQQFLIPSLDLAAINGSEQVVVAGPPEAIAQLQYTLTAQTVACSLLHTSHAYHSAMMQPIVAEFVAAVRQTPLHAPKIPYISNLTGQLITPAQATSPDYWGQHLRQTVQFADGLATLLAHAPQLLLELGPGKTVIALAKQHPSRQESHVFIPAVRGSKDSRLDEAVLLEAVGQTWQHGAAVDWAAFYSADDLPNGRFPHRLPLPTYPFERQRYWLEPSPMPAPATETGWFYLPSWERGLWPAGDLASVPAPCLIFADELGLGAALANQLQAMGQQPILVWQGEQFAQLSAHEFRLNPAQPEEYGQLLARLAAPPVTIIHCWTVTQETAVSPATVQAIQQAGFFSLLHLVQALGETAQANLVVISNYLHDVTGSDVVHPGKATLLGLARVIPQEYAGLTCRVLDAVWPSGLLPQQLLAEVINGRSDSLVAYRGRYRYHPTYTPIQPQPAPAPLRPQGVYLITGGLGGVGLHLAEYLAETVPGVRLALLGRSGDPTNKARQLQAKGAQVMVLAADVADPAHLETAVNQIRQTWGVIHGVIHAAGIAGGGLIQMKQTADIAAEFAAPVYGTLYLADLLQGEPLDFFILCSSHTAIIGGAGQAAYSAAHAFQDAFAQYTPQVTAVNWDRWQGVGMAASLEHLLHSQQQPTLTPGLTPDQGKTAFAQLLALPNTPQVIVSTAHFPALVQQTRQYQLGLVDIATPQKQTTHSHLPRTGLTNPYTAPRSETESLLVAIWQEALGLQPIGVLDDFFALGGDSLMALKLISQMQKQLDVLLKIHTFYDHPTIAALADYYQTMRWLANGQAAPELELEEGILE